MMTITMNGFLVYVMTIHLFFVDDDNGGKYMAVQEQGPRQNERGRLAGHYPLVERGGRFDPGDG